MKYKVCTLDVWGNEEDGYDINDYFTLCESVEINSDADMQNFMREYLKGEPDQYEITDPCNGWLEIAHEGKPILHMWEIDEERGN